MLRLSFATPLSLILALSCLLGSFCATAAPLEDSFTPLPNPLNVPPALLVTLDGKQVPLATLVKEKPPTAPILIHLWATRCAPCIGEMKELTKAAPLLKEKGIYVFALAQEAEGLSSVPAFLRRYQLDGTALYVDAGRAVGRGLQPAGLPTTYLVSANGQITGIHTGALDWAALVR